MGSSNGGSTDEDSVTISDDEDATTETDMDIDSRDDAVESPPPPTDSSPFQAGEKVLAYHHVHLYDAKVQKIEFEMREWKYLIHYLRWSKNWDEWVRGDRLMKCTEENIQKKKALEKEHGIGKTPKSVRASLMKPKNPNVAGGKKRKNGCKGAAPLEKLINLQIPPTLKKQLVDYCEFITHLGKLVKLPRSPNVDRILNMYLEYRLKDGKKVDSVAEILRGLRCYFDKALPAMLLYKRERQQYEEAMADDVPPSIVYGAEHLLRLFVKLPEILFYANIEEETLTELQQELQDFLKFLQKNQNTFFLSTYETQDDFHTDAEKKDD